MPRVRHQAKRVLAIHCTKRVNRRNKKKGGGGFGGVYVFCRRDGDLGFKGSVKWAEKGGG